jgi:hypothetical protein
VMAVKHSRRPRKSSGRNRLLMRRGVMPRAQPAHIKWPGVIFVVRVSCSSAHLTSLADETTSTDSVVQCRVRPPSLGVT